MSRLFKERQIYHRSDGVVHFISMSSKTQIALAIVVGAALLWVAYASVNVVFKEQIIVAKENDFRIMETGFSKRIQDAQRAYDDVNSLNGIIQQEFDKAMREISARHQMLENTVQRKAVIDQSISTLSEGLAQAGGPNGQKPLNGNRVMVDVQPSEPTPRQSRTSKLRKEAALESDRRYSANSENAITANAIDTMRNAAADLYTEQILLFASVEQRAMQEIDELRLVLATTGVSPERLITPAKISNTALAQGGPFIDPSIDIGSPKYFQRANRAALAVDELAALQKAINHVPLSSPIVGSRRFTSGYGIRRDPINGRHSSHHGIDFAAAWASPITATAAGIVRFAGTRSGFGRTVEIDHGNGFVTRYAHMNRISVKAGQKVKLHDKVGELGSSGRSTGPHVHYEILFRKKPMNPSRFIEAGRYVFES
ncbi:MAG: M23 family metallopeptidase [Marinicaulis sp.]|nr:M23 family metallopeptidase [Marinicaulis sp.]NNE41243.1 M23 family metallopeptidase [Marinicaulis sp.]NNL89840.1 M23 family metallopeptidase [Marinicaulis sp.]